MNAFWITQAVSVCREKSPLGGAVAELAAFFKRFVAVPLDMPGECRGLPPRVEVELGLAESLQHVPPRIQQFDAAMASANRPCSSSSRYGWPRGPSFWRSITRQWLECQKIAHWLFVYLADLGLQSEHNVVFTEGDDRVTLGVCLGAARLPRTVVIARIGGEAGSLEEQLLRIGPFGTLCFNRLAEGGRVTEASFAPVSGPVHRIAAFDRGTQGNGDSETELRAGRCDSLFVATLAPYPGKKRCFARHKAVPWLKETLGNRLARAVE